MKMHNLQPNDFILDEIESIELIGEEDTIDITVKDTHMFFANDIYTHNSSIGSELVEADQMGGSIKKAQIGHFIVSIAKTLAQREDQSATMAILKSRFGQSGIVFRNSVFNNATVQIETFDNDGGVSYSKAQEMKGIEDQSTINDAVMAYQFKLKNAKNKDLGLNGPDEGNYKEE